jgi:hypothetical protein
MNAHTDQREHWREQIALLNQKIEAAKASIEDAQKAASDAALAGEDVDQAARALTHARDRLDAFRTAKGEAERHLAHAKADHAQREREKALKRAETVAKKRIDTADSLDAYLAALDPILADWMALGNVFYREVAEAGKRAPGGEAREFRIRAALWASAPAFAAAIGADRIRPEQRQKLRQITAAQSAPILAKGKDDD